MYQERGCKVLCSTRVDKIKMYIVMYCDMLVEVEQNWIPPNHPDSWAWSSAPISHNYSPFDQKIWFTDWNLKFPVTNGFLKFPKNTTISQSACIPNFSEICCREFLFHSIFVPEFLVEWFKFQKCGNFRIFSKIFQELYEFCYRFEISEFFYWMESSYDQWFPRCPFIYLCVSLLL